ncbi:DUF1223 domain-containing protein [Tepidamorphus sp. 3E244]|uniref:DUF1223 domain-containing protein n=1 Tax=Tepidamorphus sp. 3E244 TaxID=3385498 RepID=UPI0038FC9551
MKVLSAVAFAAAFAILPASAGTLKPKAVAELFTSQGCSSCPPADKVWNELAERDDVLALTLPVDYWDYLGWKDTLASAEHTERQRGYVRALDSRSVYTPQGVINGRINVVGSRRQDVLKSLESDNVGAALALEIETSGDTLTVQAAPASGTVRNASLWLVVYEASDTVEIGRGENAGRTVTYSNVVKAIRPLGRWAGKAQSYSASLDGLTGRGLHCAVIVQRLNDGEPGPIQAAAVLDHAI